MGNGKLPYIFRIGLVAGDIALIILGYFLAFWIRFGFQPPAVNLQPYLRLLPLIVLLALILFNVYGLYRLERKSIADVMFSLILALFLLGIFTMAASFFFRAFAFPRSVFLLGAFMQFLLLGAWRWAFWSFGRAWHGTKRVLIVGEATTAEQVKQKFTSNAKGWFEIVAVQETIQKQKLDQQLQEVDMVVLCPGVSEEIKSNITSACVAQDKGILVVPQLYDILLFKAKPFRVDDLPLFELEPIGLTWGQRVTKRALDLLIAVIALLITAPLMMVVAILIKVTSPGPVFYTQERVGLNGSKFTVYKFRTMIDNAEELTGPVLATEEDPRITKVGKFLRATRLDELPQFINVLKGEMSVVGPRPERPVFAAEFAAADESFEYRLKVKPGITGLAQVLGKYSTEPDNKLRYDLLYLRNYSLWLDLKIILQTLKTVLCKEQANGVRRKLADQRDSRRQTLPPIRTAREIGKQNSLTM